MLAPQFLTFGVKVIHFSVVRWYIITRTQPDLLAQRRLFRENLEYEWLVDYIEKGLAEICSPVIT
jgi:hypothetical protein